MERERGLLSRPLLPIAIIVHYKTHYTGSCFEYPVRKAGEIQTNQLDPLIPMTTLGSKFFSSLTLQIWKLRHRKVKQLAPKVLRAHVNPHFHSSLNAKYLRSPLLPLRAGL